MLIIGGYRFEDNGKISVRTQRYDGKKGWRRATMEDMKVTSNLRPALARALADGWYPGDEKAAFDHDMKTYKNVLERMKKND